MQPDILARREKAIALIKEGATNSKIIAETGITHRIPSLREIEARGLPATTRIRADGSLNTDPYNRLTTPEEKRAAYLASQKRYNDKLASLGVSRLKAPGTTQGVGRTEAQLTEPPKKKNGPEIGGLILGQAREFAGAWDVQLRQEDFLDRWAKVTEATRRSAVGELKNLRTLTSRMLNLMEGNKNERDKEGSAKPDVCGPQLPATTRPIPNQIVG